MKVKNAQVQNNKFVLICFFIAGTSTETAYPLLTIAAEDILSGLTIPTSVVLISLAGPGLLVTLASPLFFDRIGKVNVFKLIDDIILSTRIKACQRHS